MFKFILHKFLDFILPRLDKKLKSSRKKNNEFNKEVLSAKLQSVGFGFRINGSHFTIRSPKKVIIGNNVHLGNNVYIAGEGGLVIKDNTHISRNVSIYTVNHNYNSEALPYDNTTVYKPVVIGRNVWIGMNVSILPGITIEDGAIIGMGSVVNRDIEKNEIVGNTSLSHIKFRPEKNYKKLERSKKYGGINGKPFKEAELKNYLKSYKQNRQKEIIFVISTGRSGSKSIVDILNQNPQNKAFHEDIKQLIRISTELSYNHNQTEYYQMELEHIFDTKIWQGYDNQILIHSDQRLWNLIPFLAEYFPNSKFVHLIRDVVPTVKSMIARKWYAKNEYPEIYLHDWAKYRLQANKLGEFTSDNWKALNQLQKCTWYWSYINNHVTHTLGGFNQNRVFKLELSKLDESLPKLSEFINKNYFEYEVKISNSLRKKDESDYNNLNSNIIENEIVSFLKLLNQ